MKTPSVPLDASFPHPAPRNMETNDSCIQDQLLRILFEHCPVGEKHIDSSTRLQQDLDLDSVGLLTLALEVENHWRIYLGEAPDDPPQTIGELVTLIEKRLREQSDRSE